MMFSPAADTIIKAQPVGSSISRTKRVSTPAPRSEARAIAAKPVKGAAPVKIVTPAKATATLQGATAPKGVKPMPVKPATIKPPPEPSLEALATLCQALWSANPFLYVD